MFRFPLCYGQVNVSIFTKMDFTNFVVVACLLSTVSLGVAALNVIVGQDIDFQCHTEDGYAPEFQRQADDK